MISDVLLASAGHSFNPVQQRHLLASLCMAAGMGVLATLPEIAERATTLRSVGKELAQGSASLQRHKLSRVAP